MKINQLKDSKELKTYASASVRDAASKEELYEVLVTFNMCIASMEQIRDLVSDTLQSKLSKREKLSAEYKSYVYPAEMTVTNNFLSDFSSTEDEAQNLEDHGFPQFVSRTEETVKKVKIDKTKLKKAYMKNALPESIASHYRFEEETKFKTLPTKAISKPTTTEEE